jgi:hypothetical protein
MWNLTPEYIEQMKEELKGRRAAIQARYADELKAVEADLEEVETLERIAYAVAVKHLPEPPPGEPPQVVPSPAEPAVEALEVAMLQPMPVDPMSTDPMSTDPMSAGPEAEATGLSRWRMRLDAHSENEPA